MEKSLISAIVPVYNAEKTIKKCAYSILEQTYTNLELLLIDDGSTDSSAEVCREIVETDARVQYTYKANGGVSSARNLGIEKASGDYIMFVDSDDWIENETLERLIEAVNHTKAEVAFPQMQIDIFDSNGVLNEIRKSDNIDEFIISSSQLKTRFEDLMKSGLLYSASGRLYNKNYLIKNKLQFDLNIGLLEDFAFNLRCLLYVEHMTHIHYVAYHFYVNDINEYAYKRRYSAFIAGTHNAYNNLAKLLSDKKIPRVPYYNDFILSYWGMAIDALLRQEKSYICKYKTLKAIAKKVQGEKLLDCFTYEGLSSKCRMLYSTGLPIVYYVNDILHILR